MQVVGCVGSSATVICPRTQVLHWLVPALRWFESKDSAPNDLRTLDRICFPPGLDVAGPDGLRPGLWPLSPGLPEAGSGLEALTEQLGEALNNCTPQDISAPADQELPRRTRVRCLRLARV